jgi:hypothetical protein
MSRPSDEPLPPNPDEGKVGLDDEPDFWSPVGLRTAETFVGRCKTARHAGPAMSREADDVLNLHVLEFMAGERFCSPQTLEYIFASFVPEHLRLTASSDWYGLREFIVSTIGLFAERGQKASYDFGSVCLNGARESWLTSPRVDQRLCVARTVEDVEYLPPDLPYADLGDLGLFPLAGLRWGYKRRPEWEDLDKVAKLPIARVTIRRVLLNPVVRVQYDFTYCRAIPDDDDKILWQGRSPGEADIDRVRTDRLSTTAILGLHKAAGLSLWGAEAPYSSLDLELDPVRGWLLYIRGSQSSLSSMLARMPVEHRAHRNAMNGKSIW